MHPRQPEARRAAVFACVVLASLWAVIASAQPAPTALTEEAAADGTEYDRIVIEALAKYRTREFEAARSLFSRAHAMQPSARTSRALGITHMALENYGLAQQELRAALTDERKPLTESQRRQVSDLLEWMRKNLVAVRLRYAPSHARAEIDERPVSIGDQLLEPGQHEVRVAAPGFQPQEQQFQLILSTTPFELRIDLLKQPDDPRLTSIDETDDESTSDAWLWVGVPSMVATLTGAGFLAAGLVAISEAEEPDAQDHIELFYERSDRGRLYTALGFGIGGAGLAGLVVSTVLKLESPERVRDASFSYQIHPTHVSVLQRF